MSRRVPVVVLGVNVFVATAEDTILAKLEWATMGASERQLRDVRALVEANGDLLDRAYIEPRGHREATDPREPALASHGVSHVGPHAQFRLPASFASSSCPSGTPRS